MYTTSTAYKTEIQKRSRTFECRVTIGDRVFTNNEVQSIDLNCGIQDVFSIGNTPSMCLELVLRNTTDTIFTTNSVNVEIGLKIGNTIEYIPLGIFNIEDIKKDDYTTKFTCYDNMTKFEIAYFSSLGDKPTLQQVVNELASKTGVQFTGTLPAYNVKKLEGFTCREVLGYVASLCGGNALITRDGNFTIVYPTDISRDVGEGVFDLQRDEVKYKVGKITCQVKEQETISKGSLGTDSMELSFENPWVTETILTDIYNRLNGFNYLGYTMKWQGDLSLDIGDIITYTDVKGVTRKLPILYRKLSYDGGLDSELSAKGETKNKNSFNSSGSMSNKVNRLVTEQAIIKEAIIEKANISDLKATNAEIANLKVKDAEIEDALIKKATIEQLNAANANIQNLIAEDARINNLVASKASITELNAVSAKIGTVEADTAIIKDLLAGNVTAGSGQIIHLTTKNVTIEDAVIKNLIAAKLSVADLQAGTISTNKFTIASTDGGLNIVGPTMQFKDRNNRVRIQMGQDTQGDFNFILRGADGTTTLIDHTGIKEKAIADNLIKSNMVAADAIGEKQINYSSLITGLNKDDNTSLIKASKVAIDLTGQSLEVAFNSLKSNVDNMEIGGRNLILNSHKATISSSGQSAKTLTFVSDIVDIINRNLGKTFVVSADIDVDNCTGPVGIRQRIGVEIKVTFTDGTYKLISCWQSPEEGESVLKRLSGPAIEVTKKVESVTGGIYIQLASTSSVICKPKLECGTIPTDWTPAPEDIDQVTNNLQTQITVAQGKIEGLIKDTTITEGSSSTSLKDAYISLKATVNGLNSTVASHTSSISTVTTELGKVDGKINTAKVDAISTAGADATSKANNALNSAKSYTNAQITKVNTRVSNAESSITQLNNSITNKVWQSDIDKTINTITPDINYAKDYAKSMEDNKGYRYKHEIIINGDSDKYYPVIIKAGNQNIRRKIVVSRSFTDQAPDDWSNSTHKGNLNVVIDTNFGGWGGAEYSWNIYSLAETYARTFAGCAHCGANVMFAIFLRGGGTTGAKYYLFSDQSLTVNKYNILPDGTQLPAPQIAYNEDLIFYSPKSDGTAYEYYAPPPRTLTKEVLEEIQSRLFIDNANQARKDIATITTEVTTVKEKAATLETNLNGITSKVTNLESTTSTINGKVNAQETRLQSTEQKVTATGVITTITEAINAGTNSLTTMQFILDKNGATIKNGRFVSKDSSGKKKYELDGQALKLYDYKATSDRVAGAIESREMVSDSSVVGMSLLCRDNKWISIDYIGSSNDDITQETSHAYMRFLNPNDLYKRQIEFFKRLHLNGNSISFSQQTGGHDSYFKANGYQLLSYLPNPSSTINRDYASWIIANNVTGEDHIVLMPRQMEIYPYIWNQGGIYTAGSISSAKIATQDVSTFSYGVRSLNSYQTADALVSDFGEGVINEDGECIVFLDEVFKELVNTNCTYRVILTAYDENEEFTSIDLKCIKKNSEYFTVKSNCIGLKFDWSIVAKEKEEEMTRLADTKLTRDLYLDVKVSDLLNAEESTKSKDIVKELTEQSLQNLEIINNEDVFLKELEIKNESILSEIERDGLNE
ncbi:hypothetical protein [Clostridium paraputrificum]|uniref:hypothetical protein n=3 Tax=Clostridium paraputrificum TaxID=29363 RepID=UPI0024800D22|nr:hypothetical protein [Clostridium paraputrificum]MDB2085840.1 hypothetical protein [Clostridium paraputrificum]